MDFQSLSRKELQTLCKMNKIPANLTNVAMANALSALPQVEGLDEFLNPTETEAVAGSPETTHRTACRTTARRKALREEPQSAKVVSSQRPQLMTRGGNGEEGLAEQEHKNANVVPITPATRRRTTAVSTRRSKKEAEVVEDEEKKVDHGKPTNETETPAAVPRSRTRATGRSICSKTNGTSAHQGYNTRRSVRLLEKNLSEMSLMDAKDTRIGKSDDVSEEKSISQQFEDSADTEEVCDAGISLQTVSNVVLEETDEGEVSSLEKNSESECQVEIDVGGEEEAEPQEEDSSLKADFETHEVSNVVHGVSDVDINNSIEVEAAQAENNKTGAAMLPESDEASKDASVEFAEQVFADVIVEVTDDAPVELTVQYENDASPLPMSPVSDDSAQIKEVLEVEAEHLNVSGNSNVQHFEPMKDVDGKAEDEKDLASPEGLFENSEESLADVEEMDSASDVIFASSATASEEDNANAISEDAIDVCAESSATASEEDNANAISEDAIDVCAESSADKSIDAENITLESPLPGDIQEDLEGKSEHLEESMGEVENASATEVTMALENDASSKKSVGVMETTESPADYSNATLESSLVEDVGAEEEKDNLVAEAEPQEANEQAAGETIFDSHTLVEGDAVSSETVTVAPIHELKDSDIEVQPVVAEQSKGIANETVPKISVEESMQNANMKQNLSTDELHKKSMRELKMLLKKLSLDGKSNCKSNTNNNNNVVKEVERKRTALQVLPENQMPQ